MRPLLVNWLRAHGLPGWLAPNYAITVGIAGIAGVLVVLWLTRRDGDDKRIAARALAIGYLAALTGGYAIEWLRVVVVALVRGTPPESFGRAAYGGLLAGLLISALVMRRAGAAVLPFFDRLTLAGGIAFMCVRCGCFLAGCDYGKPTASFLGVRFPPGSAAASEHAARGWIPPGGQSLPVHPTQLYEAALGLVALLAAGYWLRRGHRDGRAIITWLAVYAAGRLTLEVLRDDPSRGIYAGLSSAQLISLSILLVLTVVTIRRYFRGNPSTPARA